ncbi:MAG: glycosyltransferase family 1 protein [Gammaproteobacteria bacterium]
MNIGISTTSIEQHLTGGKRDGIGVYTDNLLSSLSKLDEVLIERFYYPPSVFDVFSPPRDVEATQFYAPYFYCGMLSNVIGLHDINQHLIESKVDVYHATDYKIPKLKNTPVVATLYDAIPLKNPEWASARLRWLKNRVLVNSAKWADHVITISDFMVDDIVNYWGIPRERITVVHCGVSSYWSEKQSTDQISDVKRKYGIDKPYILFVGTFQPRKNIGRIIQAYHALPRHCSNEHQLVLVGKRGWKCEELVESIRALEAAGDCVWVENAADEDLRCLYQGSKVFLFPSLSEGFGLPVLEAFASKVPVITSKGTALEEIAGDAAYLVDPYSVEDMACAITDVLYLGDEATGAITSKGIRRSLQFSWEAAAEQIHDVYMRFT